jgi:hypothetical protein
MTRLRPYLIAFALLIVPVAVSAILFHRCGWTDTSQERLGP